ncbi:PLD nuclease N-terminal domain-containing protein [Rathayibacter iranicus]|uniref:Cardiolipin synthase N-terminal domain-containing protein n=2 Tax=Rathayibacter iranicus TaxID=59737 RepID=A0AAD1EN40_9MICO|nr:hypothetical protein C7V51_13930 [Rathayibacter iranicus]MWV32034.1 hypothetical protein [Rathayibacter iranicus NCPPB 2253 = VKM Ac-1602]PPI42563.1 hypothetical protein C5E09_12780 [Rathayibacter iranicus]PPI58088.1 hypothetical protein C5E08_13690 [Rathayibacter iranicus]PPI68978.1 hypothetical protein C5E01_12735 [Rathayibacter iranicus]
MSDVTGEIEPDAGLFVASAGWYAAYTLLTTIAIVLIIRSQRARSEKLPWLALIIFVPYFGALALLASVIMRKMKENSKKQS